MIAIIARFLMHALDWLTALLPWRDSGPKHLRTGRRGEEEAYFHLRRMGYVMVARNYRSPRCRSELDLVGWDGETLCFIEVKTRTTRDVKPAEAAVGPEKQRDLATVAREFLRRTQGSPPFRFDVVSIYFEPGSQPAIQVFQNAFAIA
jgi:putative endonuclease